MVDVIGKSVLVPYEKYQKLVSAQKNDDVNVDRQPEANESDKKKETNDKETQVSLNEDSITTGDASDVSDVNISIAKKKKTFTSKNILKPKKRKTVKKKSRFDLTKTWIQF